MRNLFVVLFLGVAIAAGGQELKFGVKAGSNFSSIDITGDKTKVGFSGGVLGQLKISKFAIQPEILYSMQGAKVNNGVYNGKMNLDYINIPVMLQYYFVKGFNIEVGPQVGFLASAKFKPDGASSYSIKNKVNKTDFSINVGAAYELPVLPVGVYARCMIGLRDVGKDLSYAESNIGRNLGFQLGAFVKF